MTQTTDTLQFGYPFRVGPNGRPVRVDDLRHAEDMIEQLLFTNIGERVNRPSFGCSIGTYVFEPASTELLAALKGLILSALQTWLGDVVTVADVGVTFDNEQLRITIDFSLIGSNQRLRSTFVR
jgi:hypothetical protein